MATKYAALDSGNQLVDGGRRRTLRGWAREARRRMTPDLKRCGFVALACVAPMWITGRAFEYVRAHYAKQPDVSRP